MDTPADSLPDLPSALRDLALMLSEPTTVEGILQRVGDWCGELLHVDGVGVLIRDESDDLMVVTASSEVGQVVEQLEAELREGPCVNALAAGEIIPVPDLAEVRDRYPRFVPRAMEAGIHAIYALPMTVRSQRIGALDIVMREPRVLTDDQVATAQLLADVTMSYIANSRMLEKSTTLSEHLKRALESRVIIEQAKGTLAERHRIDATDAFERIRGHARTNRLRIHDVARDVMTGAVQL